MKYGLLGGKLGHSWSPEIHRVLGNENYELFEREKAELPELFARKDIGGLNVTIPYKTAVLPFLTEVTDRARRIGCVNTVLFAKDGGRIGDNTDYDGFAALPDSLGIDLGGRRVLILGNGATARTVRAVSEDAGAARVRILGRGDFPPDADALASDVIVNCTPVGMFPDNGGYLVDPAAFDRPEAVLDVIYNPRRTRLLLEARALGIPAAGGLRMLVRQAVRASELFLNTRYDAWIEEDILCGLRSQTDNIVLIGMPGCGKTSVGRLLAQKTGKILSDIDQRIEEEAGMPIPVLFAQEGEAGFRAREKAMTARAGRETGRVIATGGGVVKDSDNCAPLAQNGRIYYLQRDPAHLATRGRPLSEGGTEHLKQMLAERDPLYRAFADAVVPKGPVEAVADWIREDFYAHCRD